MPTQTENLLKRYKQKLERRYTKKKTQIKETLARKKTQRWQLTAEKQLKKGKFERGKNFIRPPMIRSSFVSDMEYYPASRVVLVRLNFTKFTCHPIPPSMFEDWYLGKASCRTDDIRRKGRLIKRKRWWAGKTPSLGAFFNQYILNDSTIKITRGVHV